MAVTASLTLFELKWISGAKQGVCWIRATDEDDAISELQENSWFYGCPNERALVVWAMPVRRVRRRLSGRL